MGVAGRRRPVAAGLDDGVDPRLQLGGDAEVVHGDPDDEDVRPLELRDRVGGAPDRWARRGGGGGGGEEEGAGAPGRASSSWARAACSGVREAAGVNTAPSPAASNTGCGCVARSSTSTVAPGCRATSRAVTRFASRVDELSGAGAVHVHLPAGRRIRDKHGKN